MKLKILLVATELVTVTLKTIVKGRNIVPNSIWSTNITAKITVATVHRIAGTVLAITIN